MNNEFGKLKAVSGEDLADQYLPPTRSCVKTLLPQGITILGGAPKIGKSWMVLELCDRIAKGEPIWGLETTKGTTLYLCLEDTLRRVQERLMRITDEPPADAYFAVAAPSLADGLCEQIQNFLDAHPDTVLVVVDTFQMVRNNGTDVSYAGDYQEIQMLKQLADENGISILLVHHLRKEGSSDPLNKLSGSTGITGAVDGVLILERSSRNQSNACLTCTGRDIESRELELRFEKESCTWTLVADSLEQPEILLPVELQAVIAFMEETRSFVGGNTEFADAVSEFSSLNLNAKALKQEMNKFRCALEERDVVFRSARSNGQRFLEVFYVGDASAVSDAETPVPKSFVPCVPCDPVAPNSAACAALESEVDE